MKNLVLFCYRLCHWGYLFKKNKNPTLIIGVGLSVLVKTLYFFYSSILSLVYGAYLPYSASIGENVNFVHSFYGVFISENAVVGENCTILHHVTIGSSFPFPGDAPKIGDKVFIGCNASIIGKSEIGLNCKIGAGVTIVNLKVPEGKTVVGQKPIIV